MKHNFLCEYMYIEWLYKYKRHIRVCLLWIKSFTSTWKAQNVKTWAPFPNLLLTAQCSIPSPVFLALNPNPSIYDCTVTGVLQKRIVVTIHYWYSIKKYICVIWWRNCLSVKDADTFLSKLLFTLRLAFFKLCLESLAGRAIVSVAGKESVWTVKRGLPNDPHSLDEPASDCCAERHVIGWQGKE